MKQQKKCYIYTRVSTAIQVDGYSLDVQKDKKTLNKVVIKDINFQSRKDRQLN